MNIKKSLLNNNDFVLDWEIHKENITILNELGKGEFGTVYLADWNKTPVVVKIMNTDILEEKKSLFVKELDIMTRLHHPNILQILGYIKEPFGIVMEYINNGELLDYINKNKWLKLKKKIKISIDILRGIAYLHNRKPNILIHRDLKPQNILMTPSGIPKISDFGISRFFENEKKHSYNNIEDCLIDKDKTTPVGSKRYWAPEIENGNKNYNNKVDIWSTGVILYELFEGERYNPKYGFLWNKTPKNIKNIISEMLKIDPSLRLESLELINLFESIQNKNSIFLCTCI